MRNLPPTLVTIFPLLRDGGLDVLTISEGVIEPLAPIFMADLLFPSREREGKKRKNEEGYSFISFAWWRQLIGHS